MSSLQCNAINTAGIAAITPASAFNLLTNVTGQINIGSSGVQTTVVNGKLTSTGALTAPAGITCSDIDSTTGSYLSLGDTKATTVTVACNAYRTGGLGLGTVCGTGGYIEIGSTGQMTTVSGGLTLKSPITTNYAYTALTGMTDTSQIGYLR